MEYLSDTLQIRILKRNLDLQIMEDLMQSSKRHQAPLQLVHAWYLSFPQTMSHLIQFRNGSVDPSPWYPNKSRSEIAHFFYLFTVRFRMMRSELNW